MLIRLISKIANAGQIKHLDSFIMQSSGQFASSSAYSFSDSQMPSGLHNDISSSASYMPSESVSLLNGFVPFVASSESVKVSSSLSISSAEILMLQSLGHVVFVSPESQFPFPHVFTLHAPVKLQISLDDEHPHNIHLLSNIPLAQYDGFAFEHFPFNVSSLHLTSCIMQSESSESFLPSQSLSNKSSHFVSLFSLYNKLLE